MLILKFAKINISPWHKWVEQQLIACLLILPDDPNGNLDPRIGQQLINFLTEINQEAPTIVLLTHDMNVAKRAKRIITIFHGTFTQV